MNQGTRLEAADGTVFYVTGAEHASTTELVKGGAVLTGDAGSFVVGHEGEEVVLIADGAPAGSGQTVRLADVRASDGWGGLAQAHQSSADYTR